MADQEDYRLQSDFTEGRASKILSLPGPPVENPEPVPAGPTEQYRAYLTELFSPVVIQKMSTHPEWDIPVSLDFDGNINPRDNVANEPQFRPHKGIIYGEVTAETEDSYYLTYSLYHIKDYDHPIREMLSHWTYHDNDNEGFHIRVDKKNLQVAEVETWFHNRFLLFNSTGKSEGTEPVHGKIHLENGTHVIIYAQPQGHGVRCVQNVDRESIRSRVKIMRLQGTRKPVPIQADATPQIDATYQIRNFDDWYTWALGPLGSEGKGGGMFEEEIFLGAYEDGRPMVIGRYIAGYDYAITSWARPKPMWSWDDGWDQIPIFIWHYFPSYSFESHGGSELSHLYLYNRPVEKTFHRKADELLPLLSLELKFQEEDKWQIFKEDRGRHITHDMYWRAATLYLKKYVNYLFHALG
ncbi:MAG: hypothetical protein HY401_07560 [Elusimicrobia bacterium]|nr:hypothetical protein [Elusimicrobiota bacterium]